MKSSGPFAARHFIHEHRDVHRARFGHLVVAVPGAVVLVPLPYVAVEGGLGVHLVLVHVHRSVEELHHGSDDAWMPAQPAERLVVAVRREGGARHAARFPPHLLPVHGVHLVGGTLQDRNFPRTEHRRNEEVTLLLEAGQLFGAELHGFFSCPCGAGRPFRSNETAARMDVSGVA